MNQSLKIKLGNITNLSDARFAAAAGIDYIGFCFDPSNSNYIPPVKAKQIIDWTSGSFVVAEFGNQSIKEISDIVELLNIDVVEINNDLLPINLTAIDKPIIKKIDIGVFGLDGLKIIFEQYAETVDAFHLYSTHSPLLTEENLINITSNNKIVWGLNTTSKTIKNVIETYKPYALNITGGNEEKAGVKDFDELNDVLDALGLFEG